MLKGQLNSFNHFPKREIFTNKATASGIIESDFQYSHNSFSETFYKTRIAVERTSGTIDYVPIIVSEILVNVNQPVAGKFVEVKGAFQSHRFCDEFGKRHLDLFLFVHSINIVEEEYELRYGMNANSIYVEGIITNPPTLRETPLSHRDISDFMIIINSRFGSYQIPCVAWNKLAVITSKMEPGSKIRLSGRMQSRNYQKKTSAESDEVETKTAYEISLQGIVYDDELWVLLTE